MMEVLSEGSMEVSFEGAMKVSFEGAVEVSSDLWRYHSREIFEMMEWETVSTAEMSGCF